MFSYRVNLSRPSTPVYLSDWPQTVVALSMEGATSHAYANWVDSRPFPPPPPLLECRVAVRLSAALTLPLSQSRCRVT